MKKLNKRKGVLGQGDLTLPHDDCSDLAGLVKKVYEQLVSLEKKVDTLINRPYAGEQDGGRFQKPGSRFRGSIRNVGARRHDRSRERSFTKAVCSECGQECELPFRPTGDRPVYCKDCFAARRDSAPFSEGSGKKKGSFFRRQKGRS